MDSEMIFWLSNKKSREIQIKKFSKYKHWLGVGTLFAGTHSGSICGNLQGLQINFRAGEVNKYN